MNVKARKKEDKEDVGVWLWRCSNGRSFGRKPQAFFFSGTWNMGRLMTSASEQARPMTMSIAVGFSFNLEFISDYDYAAPIWCTTTRRRTTCLEFFFICPTSFYILYILQIYIGSRGNLHEKDLVIALFPNYYLLFFYVFVPKSNIEHYSLSASLYIHIITFSSA